MRLSSCRATRVKFVFHWKLHFRGLQAVLSDSHQGEVQPRRQAGSETKSAFLWNALLSSPDSPFESRLNGPSGEKSKIWKKEKGMGSSQVFLRLHKTQTHALGHSCTAPSEHLLSEETRANEAEFTWVTGLGLSSIGVEKTWIDNVLELAESQGGRGKRCWSLSDRASSRINSLPTPVRG